MVAEGQVTQRRQTEVEGLTSSQPDPRSRPPPLAFDGSVSASAHYVVCVTRSCRLARPPVPRSALRLRFLTPGSTFFFQIPIMSCKLNIRNIQVHSLL